MKSHALVLVGCALAVSCAEKEPAKVEVREMAAETVAPDALTMPPTDLSGPASEAFIEHMHAHADKLERLHAALAAGDLEAAGTQAHWLARHEVVGGVPALWQPSMQAMRDAASAVMDAPDLASARSAAQGINQGCQGCHTAAGVEVALPRSDAG